MELAVRKLRFQKRRNILSPSDLFPVSGMKGDEGNSSTKVGDTKIENRTLVIINVILL
jgi:hypothetical protein